MNEINIARCLVRERHKLKVTQEELASYIGVSKAAVSKWESGSSFPDITLLPQLATYFNVSLDQLLGYEPQMTKEQIRKKYQYFRTQFGVRDFDDVIGEIEEAIKKYYSCFPFLLQMTVLLVNHAHISKDPMKICERALEISKRIKEESDNVNDAKEAANLEVMIYILMNEPKSALELLDESVRPMSQETESLAEVYKMLGETEKSKRVFQIVTYQHLLMLVADAALYSMLYADNLEKALNIIDKALKVSDIFELAKLQPNAVIPVYFNAAIIYCMHKKEDEALTMLEKYTQICCNDFFPFTLHGDKYFDLIDNWFEDFDIGNGAPQNEKYIRRSILVTVRDNDAFKVLQNNTRYKNILKKLEELVI